MNRPFSNDADEGKGPDLNIGTEEGDTCNRDECTGTLEYPHPEDCSCHICPPCVACTEIRLTCTACGAEPDDEV